MEKEFIPYAEALALKELGFDESCLGLFKFTNLSLEYPYLTNTGLSNSNLDKYCSAPLYQQAFRWFREKYDLDGWVVPCYALDDKMYNYLIMNRLVENLEDDVDCETYEEAQIECLKKLIEIVKENVDKQR